MNLGTPGTTLSALEIPEFKVRASYGFRDASLSKKILLLTVGSNAGKPLAQEVTPVRKCQ